MSMRLTFDDGPSEYTGGVLDALAARGLRATFFVVGEHAEARPGLVRRARQEGHEIGNHSWDHPVLNTLPEEAIRDQLERTSAAIERATGERPRRFRPPYGETSPLVEGIARQLGMTQVLWDVDPADWSRPGVDAIRAAIAGAREDDVVLLHDGRGDRSQTVAALG